MHFVGKILVVLQLVLSVLFMAFAAVVYNVHETWRAKATTLQATITKQTSDLNKATQDFQAFKGVMEAQVKAADDKAKGLDAQYQGQLAEVARLKKEGADLAVARKTAAEQASVAGDESASRVEESTNLRQLNHALSLARDADLELRTKLEDRIRALELDNETATKKNRELVRSVSILQQALTAAGIEADPTLLASKGSPPPRVEGIIQATIPPKRQGAGELVEISLGSDDGLKKDHEMTVFRAGGKGGPPRYLATIKIIKTTPDKAVGQVIENSRNGVIQKGDHVSTKL